MCATHSHPPSPTPSLPPLRHHSSMQAPIPTCSVRPYCVSAHKLGATVLAYRWVGCVELDKLERVAKAAPPAIAHGDPTRDERNRRGSDARHSVARPLGRDRCGVGGGRRDTQGKVLKGWNGSGIICCRVDGRSYPPTAAASRQERTAEGGGGAEGGGHGDQGGSDTKNGGGEKHLGGGERETQTWRKQDGEVHGIPLFRRETQGLVGGQRLALDLRDAGWRASHEEDRPNFQTSSTA